MRRRPYRLGQLSFYQLLQRTLQQFTEQTPNPVATKFCDQLPKSGIMFTGHRVSPLELVV
jgi:hypothetical protein